MFSILIAGNHSLSPKIAKSLETNYAIFSTNSLNEDVVSYLEKRQIDLIIAINDIFEDTNKVTENLIELYKVNYFCILTFFDEIIVGPFIANNKQVGCDKCIKQRIITNQKDRINFRKLIELSPNLKHSFQTHLLNPLIINIIHELISNAIISKFINKDKYIYIIKAKNYQISKHYFLPHPLCPKCSNLKEDSEETAFIEILNNQSQKGYRIKNIDNNFCKILIKSYVDTRTGVFNTLLDDTKSPFSVSVANLALENGLEEPGIGRALDYQKSKAIAILEGLERYAGFYPRGKRTVVNTDYNSIKNIALDPRQLGVHSDEQYAQINFPFKPFVETKKINWVWAYSFIKQRPILIPEFCGYYGYFHQPGYANASFYEISNGCALGSCIEEAILYGILEVIERDAFLITWYSRLQLQEIDVTTINDTEFKLMLNRFQLETDYGLRFFNMTLDSEIPCILVIAKNNKKDKRINLLCAAGCHIDPLKAIKSSIHEVTGILIAIQDKYQTRQREILEMLQDPDKVLKMEDHSLVNGLPEAEYRLEFLLRNNREKLNFSDLINKSILSHINIASLVHHTISKLTLSDMDVICLNQTTEEMRILGLFCVKILIPGMLPMTFSHNMRRVTGLHRLWSVPKKLRYSNNNDNLAVYQINHYPHPFP